MITINQRKQYKLMLYHTAEISNLSCSPEMWKKLSTMYHFHRPQNKSQSETAVLREPHSIKKLDVALACGGIEATRLHISLQAPDSCYDLVFRKATSLSHQSGEQGRGRNQTPLLALSPRRYCFQGLLSH